MSYYYAMDDLSGAPRDTHLAEFAAWLQRAQSVREDHEPQPPTEELLGEHYMMGQIYIAMEAEAICLKQGSVLRAEFWSDAVDFIGNFVHMCHRVKEEQVFYPAALHGGLIEEQRSNALQQQHTSAKRMTLGICEGIESGDWEKVWQLVSMYTYFMQRHMRDEERELVQPFMRELDADMRDEVARAFRDVEDKALAARSRLYYVDIARRLCNVAGVPHGFDGPTR